MNKDLLVICPTRERPDQCRRMIDSFDKKSSNQAELIFIVDDDDKYLREYHRIFLETQHPFATSRGESVTDMYNLIVNDRLPDYKFYSETNDDFVYETRYWDLILMDKLVENNGGIAYGDDGYTGPMLPTTSVISGDFIRALGWIHLPTLGFLCNDIVWKDIGVELKRLYYIPEVKTTHMHPLAGKAEEDNTFRRTNSDESYAHDHKAYRAWRANQMKSDVDKIREVLNG